MQEVEFAGGAIPLLHFGHRCQLDESGAAVKSEANGNNKSSLAAIKPWNFSVAFESSLFLSG